MAANIMKVVVAHSTSVSMSVHLTSHMKPPQVLLQELHTWSFRESQCLPEGSRPGQW